MATLLPRFIKIIGFLNEKIHKIFHFPILFLILSRNKPGKAVVL